MFYLQFQQVLLLMFPVLLKVHKAILTKIFSIFLKFCGIFFKMLIKVIYPLNISSNYFKIFLKFYSRFPSILLKLFRKLYFKSQLFLVPDVAITFCFRNIVKNTSSCSKNLPKISVSFLQNFLEILLKISIYFL